MVVPPAEAPAPFQLNSRARLGLTVAATFYPAFLSLRSLHRGSRRGQTRWLWYWVLLGGAMGLDALVSQLGGWEVVQRVVLGVGNFRARLGREGVQGGSALQSGRGQRQAKDAEGKKMERERLTNKPEWKNKEAKNGVKVNGKVRERRRVVGDEIATRKLREKQDKASGLKSVQQMARKIEEKQARGKREIPLAVEKINPDEKINTDAKESNGEHKQNWDPAGADSAMYQASAEFNVKEDGERARTSSKGGEDADVQALGSSPDLENCGDDAPAEKKVEGSGSDYAVAAKPPNGLEKAPNNNYNASNKKGWEAPKLTPAEAVLHQQTGEVSGTFLKDAEDVSVRERAKALTHYVETQPKFCPLKERPEHDVEALVVNTDFQYAPERKANKPVESAITPTASKVSANFISLETSSVKDKTLALQNYIDEQPKFRPAQVPR